MRIVLKHILKNIWGFSRNKWREFISTLKESDEMLDSNELKETRIIGFITLIKNEIISSLFNFETNFWSFSKYSSDISTIFFICLFSW